MAALVVLIILIVLVVAGVLYAQRSQSAWMRRKRMDLAVERTQPGPQREAARLRVKVFESLEAAETYSAGTNTVSGLLTEARAVASQLDSELAVLSRQRDVEQIRAALPDAKQRVDDLTAMVGRIQQLSATQSHALMQDSMRELQSSIENERVAQESAQQSLEELRSGGLLGGGSSGALPPPAAPSPPGSSVPPPGPPG